MFEATLYNFYWLQMTWISELTGHREWLFWKTLTDFTQLGTKLDPILNYSNIYIEWKKRLIQGCVKSEQVFTQIGDYCWLETFSAICKWTLFVCTRYYLIPKMSRCWEFVLKERNNITVMSFKRCVFTSELHHLYC